MKRVYWCLLAIVAFAGLQAQAQEQGGLDLGFGPDLFYYLRNDGTGFSTFGTISTSGAVTDRFGVGANFDALAFAELLGDFDGDGDVDADDLTDPVDGWEARFGVDLHGSDFLNWQRQLGTGVGALADSQAVPEPPTGPLLVGVAAITLLAQRQRCFV